MLSVGILWLMDNLYVDIIISVKISHNAVNEWNNEIVVLVSFRLLILRKFFKSINKNTSVEKKATILGIKYDSFMSWGGKSTSPSE